MTRYNSKQREEIRYVMKNKKVLDLEYCKEEDYYTIVLEDGEFSLRFMADLV